MPMIPLKMAEEIKIALGQGKQITSLETVGLATAIIRELKEVALVNFLPDTITGIAPPSGGSLLDGAGMNGKILAITGQTLASKLQIEMGLPSVTPPLRSAADGVANHIITAALVRFDIKTVTGLCTNTASSPGDLKGAAGRGKILGLKAKILADLVTSAFGAPSTPQLISLAQAIVDHIQSNAIVTFKTTEIFAVCSAGGGKIIGGVGSGGRIF